MPTDQAPPQLDCFVHPSWHPRIRPAAPKRDWMEASPERFAYRCLPLAIANAHGWEMLSPVGFRARWHGGLLAEDVEVEADAGSPVHQVPVSLFGQGTITFHIEGLIRTSPGWNLWVGGSPNAAKDGIAPLGAVIETDWSPYSFTMNWQFTRPGQWVRWEEDEPFLFFFPVQRGALDGVTPQVRPLAEAPELDDAFARWSVSRNAFQEHVRRTNPTAPADKWQKLYYRGVDPDGVARINDHQSKLRMAAFADPTGACPVSGARGPRPAPVPAPAAAPDAGSARALARHQWLTDTAMRQRQLSPVASSVLRVRDLDGEDFLEEFYAKSWPVVIDGAMAGWPALERWTPEGLRRTLGDAVVETGAPGHGERMPFAQWLDRAAAGGGAPVTTRASDANAGALAPLFDDLGEIEPYLAPGRPVVSIEPADSLAALRFDLVNAMFAQVVGQRRFLLLPPSETAKLANTQGTASDIRDFDDAARLARYPDARSARRFVVELNPGDLLFVPVGWWHQARAVEFGVTLTYTDFRWPNGPFEEFPAD